MKKLLSIALLMLIVSGAFAQFGGIGKTTVAKVVGLQDSLNAKLNVIDLVSPIATGEIYSATKIDTLLRHGSDSIWFNTTNHKLYVRYDAANTIYRFSASDSVFNSNWSGIKDAISAWDLDEASGTTATNLVGGKPNGTVSGDVTVNQTGVSGSDKSYLFSGTNGKIDFTNLAEYNLTATDFTLSVWVKIPNTTGNKTLLSYADRWSFAINGDRISFGAIGVTLSSILNIYFSPSVWHNIVLSYDNTAKVVNVYLDGVLTTRTFTGSMTTYQQPLHFGAYQGTTNYFSGNVAQIIILPHTVTQSQVSNIIYNAGVLRPYSLW